MTCIVNFKTKKEFKEYVAIHNNFVMEDPSIFKPYCGKASEYGVSIFCVTNHPKRSWFAEV